MYNILCINIYNIIKWGYTFLSVPTLEVQTVWQVFIYLNTLNKSLPT